MNIILFVLGSIIGSFLNVCIFRIPNRISIISPPSTCYNCKKAIKYYDLIPILSYFILRGRCRNCRDKFSCQYLGVELITGLIFVLLYWKFTLTIDLVYYLMYFSLLTIIFFIDLNHQIIPNNLLKVLFIISIIYSIVGFSDLSFKDRLLGLLISGFIFLFIIIVSRGGLGFGDLKLIAILGFDIGTSMIFLTIALSFIIGGIVGVLLIVFKLKDKKDYIAFGPFIIISYGITIFFGDKLINWYISSMF